jgi:hypothetical protein
MPLNQPRSALVERDVSSEIQLRAAAAIAVVQTTS